MGGLGYEIESSEEEDETTMIKTTAAAAAAAAALPLPLLLCLNHISYVCKSVPLSVRFYVDVLGFVLVKRPSSLVFGGAWLFNHGIGIHLLPSDDNNKVEESKRRRMINPKDNHISFQCSDMKAVIRKLEEMGIKYETAVVEEDGIKVDQLFFHDPDGYMVEICNCDNIPVIPLTLLSI